MGRRFHVEDKAMDAVLDERPQEPPHQKQRHEHGLMDGDGEVWEHTRTRKHTETMKTNDHRRGKFLISPKTRGLQHSSGIKQCESLIDEVS